MNKRIIIIICVLTVLIYNKSMAQDPQFSQYYAAPLFLNPALAGINQIGRVGINYRNQWPGIQANFETFSAYVDNNFDEKNSSIGFIVTNDREGLAGLQSTEIGFQYAYQALLNYKWAFRPAFQASYTFRNLDFTRLTFGDQFDSNGLVNPTSLENIDPNLKATYFDLALGGLFYSSNIWFGVSVHHIREPNQSFLDGESPLPRKTSVHGGYRFPLKSGLTKGKTIYGAERSISPTFNFRSQGGFDQLDLGVYLTLDPIILGLWYRGIPVKKTQAGGGNSESLITMFGIRKNNLTIGYSFDYTLSKLGIGSGGAHEVSAVYTFRWGGKRKPSRDLRELKCPIPFIF
jgi:type IX secretion system PorP/SprF family membrane protein